MGVSLGSNISSIKAQRQLGKVTTEVSTVFERLSSGQRINRAADDAAGLAVVSSLQNNRRVFTQGIRNYNDGISLLNVSDGAIEQLSGIAIRLKELAEQAANGTYGVKQRKALDAEAQALSKEYFRIARSTTFNGRGVFFAEFGELRLQGGYGANGGIQSGLGGAIGIGELGSKTAYSGRSDSIALGDLNGDGILDMVGGGSYVAAQLQVQLGRGDGSFQSGISYLAQDGTVFGIALGDINGDQIIDVVSAGYDGSYNHTVSLRLGRGDGTFGAVTSLIADNVSSSVSLRDMNNDGALDILSTEQIGGGVRIRLGNGNGAFGSAAFYSMENVSTEDLAIADLNSDGFLDLVSSGGGGATGRMTVRLGNGNGTFGGALSYTMQTGTSFGVTLADFNGDSFLDAVSVGSGANDVVVRLGTGNGTFGADVSYDVGYSGDVLDVKTGDFNGDGNTDIAMTGTSGVGKANLLFGRGDGTFANSRSFDTESNASQALAVGDINGDGVIDLATAGIAGGGIQTVYLSTTAAGINPLLDFTLTTRSDSLNALTQFDKALSRLANQRGIIGAFQSRITVAGNLLQATTENYAAAAGRIKDADVADESSKLVRTQILQQAASAVLAQANQQPALALQLLS